MLSAPPAAAVVVLFVPLGAAFPLLQLGLYVGAHAAAPPPLPCVLSAVYGAMLLLLLALLPWVQRFNLTAAELLPTAGLPDEFFCGEAVAEMARRHQLGVAHAAKGATECTVCCERCAPFEEVVVVDVCGHAFHRDCISQWLSLHSSCPNCRARCTSLTPIYVSEL